MDIMDFILDLNQI